MSTRRHRMLLTLVSVALLAAACGGEVADSGEAPDTEPSTAEPETETAESEPETAEPEADGGTTGSDTAEGDDSAPAPNTADSQTAEAETADPETADPETAESETAESELEAAPLNVYDDPRDGIFDEFQATMDRGDHPFMQIDAFCKAHDPAPDRAATDAGIGADSITLVHLRTRLEELVAYGFGTAVGDVAEMFETFAAVVNEQCGGVRGRMIELHTISVPATGDERDREANAACIEATEDLNGVILLAAGGFPPAASLCIVEDHETALVTGSTQPEEFLRRGEDRLVSLDPTVEQQMNWLALDLIAQGRLDGKTVGVAAPDAPGEYEAVEAGLVDVLEANGVEVAVFDQIGCHGGACFVGMQDAVQRMRDRGVDVVFNVLNAVSAPGFVAEMVTQGFEPGDVQFYASDFNAQSVEIVASKIAAFGGDATGRLYNGAVIQSYLDTGSYRLDGYEPRAFNEMCNDTYGANSASGANHESEDRATGVEAYGMTVLVCEIMRVALRAVHDAGDNPTRADIYATLASLGPVDSNDMIPSSIRPGKTSTPDAIHDLVFEYPCTQRAPFGDENICIYPITEYRLAPGM